MSKVTMLRNVRLFAGLSDQELEGLADRYGVEKRASEIELRLTQAELASWVAASRESVNKALVAFRDQGLIEIEGQRITVLDRRGLRRRVLY
jgi:CRP/FNR family cyclic AMP-dependent transcriptional regulator